MNEQVCGECGFFIRENYAPQQGLSIVAKGRGPRIAGLLILSHSLINQPIQLASDTAFSEECEWWQNAVSMFDLTMWRTQHWEYNRTSHIWNPRTYLNAHPNIHGHFTVH